MNPFPHMPMSVCVAADVLGRKRNLEFVFDSVPTLLELRSVSERSFNTVLASEGIPRNFVAANFRIFDERIARWVDLEVSTQLVQNAQVYVFQPGVAELAGEIPPAVRASEITYVSPRREVPLTMSPRRAQQQPSLPPFLHDGEGEPFFQGESILRQERANEERKDHMDLDAHRELVRRETKEFLSQSPARSGRGLSN